MNFNFSEINSRKDFQFNILERIKRENSTNSQNRGNQRKSQKSRKSMKIFTFDIQCGISICVDKYRVSQQVLDRNSAKYR